MRFITSDVESEGIIDFGHFRSQTQVLSTSASTLVLTLTSNYAMLFIGTTAGQEIQLPNATTLRVGHHYLVHNNSTQNINLNNNGSITLAILGANQRVVAILQDNSTTNGIWSLEFTVTGTGFGNGAGINFGFDGNASSGRWLESNTNIASNNTGITIPSITFIKAISVGAISNATVTFTVFGSTAAANAAANFVSKTTASLTAQRKFSYTGLNIPIAANEEIAVQVTSGSCSRPVVTLYIQ